MFEEKIAELIAKIVGIDVEDSIKYVEPSQHADYQSRIAFFLAKKEKKNPVEIAKRIVEKIEKPFWLEAVVASGPYINFDLSLKGIEQGLKILEQGFEKKNKTVMVEFPSVNPNKPWHVGHLRNAILGDTISNILEYCGYGVLRVDYIDDLGLQVAKTYWAIREKQSKPDKKYDHWLGEQYVIAEKESNEEEVKEILKNMEQGSLPEVREMSEKCVKEQYKTAFNYMIYHDYLVFESNIVSDMLGQGLELLKQNTAIVKETSGKNKGCWVVKLDYDFGFGKLKDPDKILIRSDGTLVYTGKDVIFHLWKAGLLGNLKFKNFIEQPNGTVAKMSCKNGEEKDLKADILINVIGSEQKYPQAVIREVLKKLNISVELKHLAYEHVELPEGRFSGRKGTWKGYTADELYEESLKRVNNIPEVAAAAIRFAFLKVHPSKKIIFNWEDAVSLEGGSGPYLQYSLVRAKSILSKISEKGELKCLDSWERELLIKILMLRKIIEKSSYSLEPHTLANYCLELANLFNKFYEKSPILKETDIAKKMSRIFIVKKYVQHMLSALALLGIQVPEKM